MWRRISLRQFQHDIDEDRDEWCGDKIARLRKISANVHSKDSKIYFGRKISRMKKLRGMR